MLRMFRICLLIEIGSWCQRIELRILFYNIYFLVEANIFMSFVLRILDFKKDLSIISQVKYIRAKSVFYYNCYWMLSKYSHLTFHNSNNIVTNCSAYFVNRGKYKIFTTSNRNRAWELFSTDQNRFLWFCINTILC